MIDWLKLAGRLPVASLALLAIAAGLELQSLSAQTQIDDRSQAVEIEQLLRELGDDSFAARQRAMDKIWRSGNLSIDVLQRYARSADPEAVNRIHRIIRHMEMGITPGTDPEVARLVYSFHSADEDGKSTTLYDLREAGHHKLVMDLLMSVEDTSLQEYLSQNAYESGSQVVSWMMPSGFDVAALPTLDALMDHSWMWQFHIDDCVVYWELRGQAKPRINRLEKLAAKNQATDDQLLRLVWFHRMAGRRTQSLIFARQLSEAPASDHSAAVAGIRRLETAVSHL